MGRADTPCRVSGRAALAVALITTGGCRADATTPVPMTELGVTMTEYAFEFGENIPAGPVLFRARNLGAVGHEAELVPLDEDFPPIDEQFRGDERRAVTPVAAVRPLPPGAGGAFVADLEPNRRYALICFLRAADNQSHAGKGMTAEFRTGP